jgi:hypothetical protein
MRKARHNGVGVSLRLINESRSQPGHLIPYALDGSTKVEPDVGSHLIVSGAACVQALAGVANQLSESRFNVHVHIF